MKGRAAILDWLDDGREAAALMVDGRLHDLLIDPPDDIPPPGTLFRAVVDRPVKGIGGVFLKLPEGGRAFLRQTKGLKPGQSLLVQVTGHAEPGKAVPVTPRILFKSRYAIVTPEAPGINLSRAIRDEEARARLMDIAHAEMDGAPEGVGLILRSACEAADEDAVTADIVAMRELAEAILAEEDGPPELLLDAPGAHLLAWRDWSDVPSAGVTAERGAFAEMGVLDAIDALAGAQPLPAGASLFVEPTHALVAVDVNTGPDTSPAAGLKANIAAARDLPRQLRLRGLGGQVVIDFAPMPKKERVTLEQALRAAFRGDAVDTALAGWTPLGNYEMQRKRERRPLSEVLPR